MIKTVKCKLIVTETDKAYAAGLIDGEGCISISRVNYKRTSRKTGGSSIAGTLHIAMTDRAAVDYVRQAFGNVGREATTDKSERYARLGWKPTYHWVLSTQQAAAVLKEVLPYLRVKRRQAELLIKLADMRASTGAVSYGSSKWGRIKVDPHIQEAIYAECRTLNVRGTAVKGASANRPEIARV